MGLSIQQKSVVGSACELHALLTKTLFMEGSKDFFGGLSASE